MAQFDLVGCGRRVKFRLTAGRTYDEIWSFENQTEATLAITGPTDWTTFDQFRLYVSATEGGAPLYVIRSASDPQYDANLGSVEIEGTVTDGDLRVVISHTVTRALQDTHGLRWGHASLEGVYQSGEADLGQCTWFITHTPQEN